MHHDGASGQRRLRLAALAVNVVSYTDDALSPGETAAMRVGSSKVLERLAKIRSAGKGDSPREADLLHRCASYLGSCLARHKSTAESHGSVVDDIGGDDYDSLARAVSNIDRLMQDRRQVLAGPKFALAR